MENTIEYLQNTVLERVKLMSADPKVQSIMMGFEKKQDAIDWLYKAAIATLYGRP